MKRILKKTWHFSFFLLIGVSAKAQDKVYMPFFEIINMNYGYQYSTSKLLKTYLDDGNRFILILPSKHDSLYQPETFEITKGKAASHGAKYFIVGELNRVGEMVLVSIALYNTSDGVKVWNDKLRAQNPDDIDAIIQRIAKNIGTPNKATTDGDIYSVTNYEKKEVNKINSSNYFGTSIGSTFMFTSLASKPLTGLSLFWSYDLRNLIMELKTQGYWGSNLSVYDLSLEAYYPLKSNDRTPFIGGGFGISGVNDNNYNYSSFISNYDQYHGSGLMLLVGGGYIFNRTSNTELRLSGNGLIATYYVNNQIPLGVILKMEFLFHR